MAVPRTSRVRLIWWLEVALGLELYACAVMALHAHGLGTIPLLASPALVRPALMIPPVFYVLVGIVTVRPLSLPRVTGAAAAMCGLHVLFVVGTGVLFMIPDLLDYGEALAFASWGSPAVTVLQLTAVPLVFVRLRPLLPAARPAPRGAAPPRRVATPGIAAPRTVAAPAEATPSLAPRPFFAPPMATPTQRVLALTSPVTSPMTSPVAREPVATTPAASPPPLPLAVSPEEEPMIRVSVSRIADQLPVEMFARGRQGLIDTLRPGVALLVPRRLLLPHLGEGLAPVKWEVVADQFPPGELAQTHDQVASRLPDGSLMLPLDEVLPQIPLELLALSTPAVDVYGMEEFPPPFQPHVPPPSETAVVDAGRALEPPAERTPPAEAESSAEQEAPQPAPPTEVPLERGRTAEARRIATRLAPLMNGLEIGERAGAGMALVTAVAPTVSEESVVRTAERVASLLTDARLSEPVTQATLMGAEATIVLTPFGSGDDDGALLVTAVASRGSLAWVERLSRSAAAEASVSGGNGHHSEPNGAPRRETEVRAASAPPPLRELARSLTAFGPVVPTVVCDTAGSLSACLFLPSSLEALPLAEFARDLYDKLEGAEIGPVASVVLKIGAQRLVLRAMEGASGRAMLVGGGPIDRPGLARIELDRAAMRLAALARS